MNKKREFDAIRKLQDEEYEHALQIDSQKTTALKMDALSISTKKPKILEAPTLLPNPNIRLKIRIFSGKLIACHFHENELIKNVLQQLKWLLHLVQDFYLFNNGKILPISKSLLECGIVDRTTLIANS